MSTEQLFFKNLRWGGVLLALISVLGYNSSRYSYDGASTAWTVLFVLSLILIVGGHKYWQYIRSTMDED